MNTKLFGKLFYLQKLSLLLSIILFSGCTGVDQTENGSSSTETTSSSEASSITAISSSSSTLSSSSQSSHSSSSLSSSSSSSDSALLDRTNWVLDASHNTDELGLLTDGDLASRWATRAVQAYNQWLTIDLGANQSFNTLQLSAAGSGNDYPRRYAIYISDDGENWGAPIAAGLGNAETGDIVLARTQTRHIRITQTGSDENYWWSIHELNILDDPNAATANNTVSLPLGYKVYQNKACFVCHGDIADSSKRRASAVAVTYALEHEVEMENLSLTPAEIESVALALSDDEGICRAPSDPGPVVMRRLSNHEYINTLRDLLGVVVTMDNLPSDSRAGNFTNVGSSNVNSEHALGYARIVPTLSQAINATDNPIVQSYLVCDITNTGVNCARSILEQLLRFAFRRDVQTDEVERYVDIYRAARDLEETRKNSLAVAVEAILLSPHFTFIVEVDENPQSTQPRALNDFELASRLSYFIWASMPDKTLLDLASNGTLSSTEVLNTQIDRMLNDTKSRALVDVFFEQWMTLTDFNDPNNTEYSHIDAQLRQDMVEETKQIFIQEFIHKDNDLRNLLSLKTTYANNRLATHYGIDGIAGEAFQATTMAPQRAGLLTQASILTSTAKEKGTSPVARGKWVLDQLLCEPPRTPPPDVADETINEGNGTNLTLKERLTEHRQNPACAACHETMDPIGFGLEQFDQLGHLRTTYNDGTTVDSEGELPDGQIFNGAAELADILKTDARYMNCVSEKFISYARGSLTRARDNCRVKNIAQTALDNGFSVRELIRTIIHDASFTTRRTADED